jgi:hypothetical protein
VPPERRASPRYPAPGPARHSEARIRAVGSGYKRAEALSFRPLLTAESAGQRPAGAAVSWRVNWGPSREVRALIGSFGAQPRPSEIRIQLAGRQDDIDVVGIGRERRDEPSRASEAGGLEYRTLGGVSDDADLALRIRQLKRFGVAIERTPRALPATPCIPCAPCGRSRKRRCAYSPSLHSAPPEAASPLSLRRLRRAVLVLLAVADALGKRADLGRPTAATRVST